MGVSIRKRLKDSFMVKVWRTGGFIVNSAVEDNKQYYSQSGHGTCVFGRTKALKELHFEEELWLQDAKYALPDDMVMFYKLYLRGNVIAMNREVEFVHLDAGSSLMDDNKKLNNIYASARNGLIFCIGSFINVGIRNGYLYCVLSDAYSLLLFSPYSKES